MISPRQDIANGTRESIHEWGFTVLLVHADGETETPMANGRKVSQDVNSDGLPIVNDRPYLVIAVADLITLPKKGAAVKAPADFFRPGSPEIWYKVDNVPITDNDWFVKIFLTATEQQAAP